MSVNQKECIDEQEVPKVRTETGLKLDDMPIL
jgi:hypothetical protein